MLRDSPGAGGFSAVTRTRFADHAYAVLFHKIVTGELAEGAMLPSENELAALFGVSRPVVREALERLRGEGLIASRQGLGSFVQPRPPLDASSAYVAEKTRRLLHNLEFRAAVEPYAAALAAERRTAAQLQAVEDAVDRYEQVALREGDTADHLDYGFHLAVAVASGNPRFVEAVETVEHDIDHGVNLVRYLVRFDHLQRSRSVHADHAQILQAIREKRPEAARAAMVAHLENARRRMVDSQPALAKA